jgi:salicylate hydroxylase
LIVPAERLPANIMGQVMSVWMGPGRHAVCYYLRGGALLNFVGLVETDDVSEESWTAKYPWERLKADFDGWHQDIQTVIDRADRQMCFRWSLYYRPPIAKWSTRRATMLGDAVHATLPYLAQGAAMAIEDGAVLTRALGLADDAPDALQLYERNRIERTSRIVNGSGANRTLFHMSDQGQLRQAFANRDEGKARNEWLYSYNPLTVELR